MPQQVYRVLDNKVDGALNIVTCEDEQRELQDLLESDLQLIPSDQISDDNPPPHLRPVALEIVAVDDGPMVSPPLGWPNPESRKTGMQLGRLPYHLATA